MRLTLPYGRGSDVADLPDGWRVTTIDPKKRPRIDDPKGAVECLLDRPIGTPPFDDLFRGKRSVAVIVPDVTRKGGVDTVLPIVLGRLEKLGLDERAVTVAFATGIHPAQTDEQKRSVVGDEVFERYRCVDHDAKGELEVAGTMDGSPFLLNPHVARADGIVVIGSVKLHYLAGFGGGRKALLPGVTSYEQCMAFHRLCLDPHGPRRHPNVGPGVLEGNPLHDGAMQAARAAGVDFIVNTVLDPEGGFLFLNGGDLEESFLEACRFVTGYSTVPLAKRADVIIASCGGYPADIDLIQSHKSFDTAFRAVKPGGALLLLSECARGVGNDDFLDWFRHGTAEEMYAALRDDFRINRQTAAAVKEKAEGCRVVLVSSLPDLHVRAMGMTPVESFAAGVRVCREQAGDVDVDAVVLPHASLTLPVVVGT